MRYFLILLLPYFLFSSPDFDPRGNLSENYMGVQGRVNLKLQSMTYKQTEPIYIDVSIKNFGNEVIRIFPTNSDLKTFQFQITDEEDNNLSLKEDINLQEIKSAKIRTENLVGDRVKEIIIHKNESFLKRFDLNQFYNFEEGKKYFVTVYFYPNYFENKDNFQKSENQAIFQVDKNKIQKSNQNKFSESELSSSGLTPEEIMFLFLGAEFKKNWANYFKYINFPEFILGYTKYANEYTKTDEAYKELVVDEFKKYLSESKQGVLTYYKVLSVDKLNSNMAKVYVHAEREQNRSVSKFEYQYILKKDDDKMRGFWKISSVVVRVKK